MSSRPSPPTLRLGDIVITDNLPAHKIDGVHVALTIVRSLRSDRLGLEQELADVNTGFHRTMSFSRLV